MDAAVQAHQAGRIDEARSGYRRVLEALPDSVPTLRLLGILEHLDGQGERALDLLRRAQRLQPSDPDVALALANVLSDRGALDEAQTLYRQRLEARPEDPSARINLSIALRRAGDFEAARSEAEQAVSLQPRAALAWMALGNAQTCSGQTVAALRSFEEAVRLDPALSPAHHSLALLLQQQDRGRWWAPWHRRRAQRAYQRWADAAPDQALPRFMLSALQGGAAPARMPDAVVRDTFDRFAPDFEPQLRRLGYAAPESVAEALPHVGLAPDASLDVLDAGCGTGWSGRALRPFARRLVGVDLSPGMLRQAAAGGHYDQLDTAEIGAWLSAHPDAYDLIAAVDVLVYFGALAPLFAQCARALRAGGWLAFTVEQAAVAPYVLQRSGRYAHHRESLAADLAAAGFRTPQISPLVLRNEQGQPVHGWRVLAQTGR